MIFFREKKLSLIFREKKFFGQLKVFYQGEVDPQSGMVVNLRDVDQWVIEAMAKAPPFQNLVDCLKFYFDILKEKSSQLLRLELCFNPRVKFFYAGEIIEREYALHSFFKEGQLRVQRPLVIRGVEPLKLSWRQRLAQKTWSSPDACAKALYSVETGLSIVEIGHPEWSGSKIWKFSNPSS